MASPEDAAAEEAEMEDMSQIRADAVQRMGAAGKRFVSGRDDSANQLSLR